MLLQKSPDHIPPASTTEEHFTEPFSVTTVETAPVVVSIPRTAVFSRIIAPFAWAARAMAGAAIDGSARPSERVYRAPAQCLVLPGSSSFASAAEMMRESTP